MMMDTTIEAAQEILKDSPSGVLCYQDELSGFFGSMDKYSGARGAQKDRAFWLQTYNGGSYTVSRITRGNVHIDNLSASILGGIQPDPIRKLADGGEDDGLLQRFIPVMLRPAVDGRDEAPGQSVSDYSDLIRNLRDLKPPTTGHIFPPTSSMTFDDGALKIRKELERKHLDLVKLEGINRKLTSHFGKYNGIFARLCVVWHCVEHVNDDELPVVVTEATARRVAGFLHGFLLKHAIAFYSGVLGLANDHDRLANVADYILAHKKEQYHQPRYPARRQKHAQPDTARDRRNFRTARCLRLDNENSRTSPFRPAALDRQSCRASEVCRESGGGEEAPGTRARGD